MGCQPLELIALSGGSEANNMALKGFYEKYSTRRPEKTEILISAVEHPSVKSPAQYLKQKGMTVKTIPIHKDGTLDTEFYLRALQSQKVFLVSVMYANNETGHIFPIPRLARMARKAGAFFHCDGVQALGKLPLQLHGMEVDTMSFSAHKFYALKGTGLLYCRKGLLPENLIHGGPQERKRRAGTENVLGLLALGAVAEKGQEILNHIQNLAPLRDEMEKEILDSTKGGEVVGGKGARLPNTSCFYMKGVEGGTLLMNMDLKGYSFSVGSACHSGSLSPSDTLQAMGWSQEQARSVFRISLGLGIRKEHIKAFVRDLASSIHRIRSLP